MEDNYSGIPVRKDINSKGQLPKTLNEMEVELHTLHKENFDLKMTIYYQKELMARLQNGDFDAFERQKDLEETIADLEYRIQEKDARIDELEFQLENSRHGFDVLKGEVCGAVEQSSDYMRHKIAHQQQLEQMETLIENERKERQKMTQERDDTQLQLEMVKNKLKRMEEEKSLMESQVEKLESQVVATRRALEDSRNNHRVDLSQMKEELRAQWEKEIGDAHRLSHHEMDEWKVKVQEMERKLIDNQNELREVRRRRDSDIAHLNEKLEATRRELNMERTELGAREAVMRTLEKELEKCQKELRLAKANEVENFVSESTRRRQQSKKDEMEGEEEVQHLRKQLAVEKRAKQDLELDFSDARRYSKQQLREMMDAMLDFDRVMDQSFKEFKHSMEASSSSSLGITSSSLFPPAFSSSSSSDHHVASSSGGVGLGLLDSMEEGGEGDDTTTSRTTTRWDESLGGKAFIRQAQDLVRKWKSRIQLLPCLSQQLTEKLTLAMMHHSSGSTTQQQQRPIHNNSSSSSGRLASSSSSSTSTSDRLTIRELKMVMEKQDDEMQKLNRYVAENRDKCDQYKGEVQAVIREKELLVSEKKKLQQELDRLLRQLEYREDIIGVFKETFEQHGLDKIPNISAQLRDLQDQLQRQQQQHHQYLPSHPVTNTPPPVPSRSSSSSEKKGRKKKLPSSSLTQNVASPSSLFSSAMKFAENDRNLGNAATIYGSSSSNRTPLRENHHAGIMATPHSSYSTRKTPSSKPIANLEKISQDLQEIAAKLEHYKSGSLSSASKERLLSQLGKTPTPRRSQRSNTFLSRLG